MPEFNQYPKELTIVVTDRCNLNCFICNREEYEQYVGCKGLFLDMENLRKLDKAIRHAEVIDLSGFGESFLHPQFEDILQYIYSLNPSNDLIKLITNGTLLSPTHAALLRRRLRCLAISLNAANPEVYRREMGATFDKTVAKIKRFLSALPEWDREKVELHYVSHRMNFHDMPRFVMLAGDLGISNVCFTPYLVNKKEHACYSLLAVPEDYNAAMEEARRIGTQRSIHVKGRKFLEEPEVDYNTEVRCQHPFQDVIINVDGQALPCCFCGFFRGVPSLGNAYESDFETVWFGEGYNRLREKRYLPACRTCNQLLTFDAFHSHFHPVFRSGSDFSEAIRLLDEDIKAAIARLSLQKQVPVDWNLYQFPKDIFGPEYSRALNVTGTHPAEENEDRSQACPIPIDVLNECYEKAFRTAKIQAVERYEIDLGGLFYGSNWGFAESNVHGQRWRWLGPEDHSHLFLSLEPGPAYTVRTYIHTASAEAINAFRLQIDDEIPAEQGIASEGGDIFHWCMLPRTSPLAANGAVKITYSLGDIGEPHRARSVLKTSACRKIALSRVVCCPNSVSSHSPA